MDATALIRAHINSALDGVAADHLLTHLPISALCAALAAILQSDDEGAIRDACLVIRDGALLAPPPGRAVFRVALHEYGIIEFVEGNLFADDHFIRDTAVYTLGKIGATESLPALRLAFTLYRDADPLLVPGIIFESAWLGEDKWTLIDSALNSPVYATRWSTIYELSRSAEDLSYKEKQVVRLVRLAKDENALVRDEAAYVYSMLTAAIPHELPRPERKRRRQELERHKPTITFADCEIRFGNYLSHAKQSAYSIRELETFITALMALPAAATSTRDRPSTR